MHPVLHAELMRELDERPMFPALAQNDQMKVRALEPMHRGQ